jgi:hypothetical protein
MRLLQEGCRTGGRERKLLVCLSPLTIRNCPTVAPGDEDRVIIARVEVLMYVYGRVVGGALDVGGGIL